MNLKEEAFFAKLLTTFRIEADEHIKALSDGLLALEKGLSEEERQQTIEKIFREAHSLKGAARSVNQQAIEKICQSLESIFAIWKQEFSPPPPAIFNTLYEAIDILGPAIIDPPDSNTIYSITERLDTIASGKEKETPSSSKPVSSSEFVDTKPLNTKERSIRISLSKMNQLFQGIEEMLMIKLISQQQILDLKDHFTCLRKQEKEVAQFASEIQTLRQNHQQNPEAAKKIGVFLDRQQEEIKLSKEGLNRLIKNADQNFHFIESIVDTLLEDMKKALMQPINTLFEVFPRMIRDISNQLGKKIKVEFQGGEIEVDRRILEEIKDPLIHLIRNAIDHGIEAPEERKKKNKSVEGTIKVVAAESHGNTVEISVSDDGKGIDGERLKQSAVQQGLIAVKEADGLTEEELIKLAFQSGVSTSPILTELSGRGLGLGIVSEKTDKLGGHVFVETMAGQGATFKIILPLTLATFRGIHITVCGESFYVPTHNVKRVLRVKRQEIKTIESYESIVVENHSLAFVDLADLLGLSRINIEKKVDESVFALIISALEKSIAFRVDLVHQEHEILVKSLGKPCVRLRNIMAAAIMESGEVIPILNPADLIHSATNGKISAAHSIRLKPEAKEKVILLAEDSITTRLLLKNILDSANYKVITAADGLEAWEVLQTHKIDLILTDVEMPRMTGFSLVEKVKAHASLSALPVVICTARGSKEDRERGIDLGASAYIDKSTFTQQGLLGILQKLI